MPPQLDVRLDAPLPAELAVGRGTAVFLAGTCFAAGERVASLSLLVDGEERPAMAHGMPRLDVLRALDEPAQLRQRLLGHGARRAARGRRRSRSGCVRGSRAAAGRSTSSWRGSRSPRPWSRSRARPRSRSAWPRTSRRRSCSARQLDSIRAQTHGDWVCVISDDCSAPEGFAALSGAVAGDPRFVVSRSPRRLGFYRNFERALALAPAGARYVALADQDDVWHPDKLETLLAEIGDARLVYSDARVDRPATAACSSDTYWRERRNNHSDLLSLLVANAVTGAASLFRARSARRRAAVPAGAVRALPRPLDRRSARWRSARMRFVDRPLYDYVQHGGATLGHEAANRDAAACATRLGALRRDPRERVRLWRMHYFVDACRLLQFATILELRCGDRMSAAQAPLARAASCAPTARCRRSARLALRGARELVARRPETLGAEWMLLHAFAWRRLLAATARERPQRRLRLDAVPPPRSTRSRRARARRAGAA